MSSRSLADMTKEELLDMVKLSWYWIEQGDDPFDWKLWFWIEAYHKIYG